MSNLKNVNDELHFKEQTPKDFYRAIFTPPTAILNTTVSPNSKILSSDDSGKKFFVTESADCTLPPAATAGAGWNVEFVVSAAPVTAPGYFFSSSDTSNIIGNVVSDGANDYTAGADVITFVNAEAEIGDRIKLDCDGTNFFVQGFSSASAGITLL
jgi:hypothetical protein